MYVFTIGHNNSIDATLARTVIVNQPYQHHYTHSTHIHPNQIHRNTESSYLLTHILVTTYLLLLFYLTSATSNSSTSPNNRSIRRLQRKRLSANYKLLPICARKVLIQFESH